MLLTEAEARERWCPFARTYAVHETGAATHNRGYGKGKPEPDCLCLASACMAWRWMPGTFEPPLGYCGLAGSLGAERPPE